MENAKKVLYGPYVNDFLGKLFILCAVLYLVFFGIETVLPGIVMDVLNINYFLLPIFVILLLLRLSSNKESKDLAICAAEDFKKSFSVLIVVFLSAVFVVVLYRVSLVERLTYLLLALIVVRMTYFFLEE
ncbi:MAG: hypothetical protein U9O20_02865 [Patescibacteria group bacterium]|nr:hypothetical protein [Patescibacteria group bacterium]